MSFAASCGTNDSDYDTPSLLTMSKAKNSISTNSQYALINKHYWMQLVRGKTVADAIANKSISKALQQALAISGDSPNQHIPWESFKKYVEELMALGVTNDWLLDSAASLNPATHGPLGLAALSARSVQQALEIIAEHASSRQTIVNLSIKPSSQNNGSYLYFSPNVLRDELYELFESSVQLAITNIISNMAEPITNNALRIYCVGDSPTHKKLFDALAPNSTQYNQQNSEIYLSNDCLKICSIYADKETCQTNLIKCYKDKIHASKDNRGLDDQIESLLRDYFSMRALEFENNLATSQSPSVETVAKQLNISTRTMHRRLKDIDKNFKSLWLSLRQREAENLLAHSTYSISEIAELIGYNDPGNFIRAFKQYHHITPAQWRQENTI